MKKLLFLLSAVLYADCPEDFIQFHEAPYKVGWDIHFSPFAGGEDVLFVHRSLERIEGYFLEKTPIYYERDAKARFWRLNELYLGWMPLNFLAVTVQHEVFGHGYRIRDINRRRAKVTGYTFNAPPPFGHGGAATYYKVGDDITTTEETAISMAGVESTAILAQLTKFKWLQAERIDPRQSVLYLLGQHDLNLYIGTLKVSHEEDISGHDIHAYIKLLNYTYTSHFISSGRLRSLSWINLADPFTFYSIYAWFYYIVTGKETRIPMFCIKDVGILPNLRLGLTPFGPELFVENYLAKEGVPFYFYVKAGNHADNFYAGLGFYAPQIWTYNNWQFGLRFDGYRQPKLLLHQGNVPFDAIDFDQKPNKNNPIYPYSEQHKMHLGAAGSCVIAYQTYRSGFEAELGYKGGGFLPGYSLRASPTVRLFYRLIF